MSLLPRKGNKNTIRIIGNDIDRKLWRKANVQALVVCMLASHIEGLAVDLHNDHVVELSRSIRQFSSYETGEAFGNVSEMFDTMIDEQKWSKSQLLVALCWILKKEIDKLQKLYFEIDTASSFPKHAECVELYQLFKNDFVAPNITKSVNEVIIYFKESCNYYENRKHNHTR